MKKEITKQQQSYINSLLDLRKKRTEKPKFVSSNKEVFANMQDAEREYKQGRKEFYDTFQINQRLK